MEEFNLTSAVNSSLLRMRDVTSTEATVVAIRNATVSSNAYEWRFILPPYILIFLLSISGNCLVIATLASNRRMRTVTNVYLLNLAISDFLLGVFCLPFTLVGQIYRRFLFGALLCKLIPFLQAVSVSVDVWTLVAISLERYFAICRPLKSRKWQTQCHAYKMIAVVWVLSIALNWPILIVSKLQPMRGNAYKCREVWTSLELERAFNLGLDVALLLVPFFIMSFAYCLIVTKLWRGMRHEIQHSFNWQRHLTGQCSIKNSQLLTSAPILQGNSSELCCKNWTNKKETEGDMEDLKQPQSYCMHTVDMEFRHVVRSTHIDKSIEAKRKVIRMLFVIILEFFVCWTPLHVINTIYLFYPEELYTYIGSKGIVCLQLLAYCASCCNPITYCFMNRKFRQAFITLLKTCRIFRGCFPEKLECKQATPPPSSQDVTACIVRGSHTGRTVTWPVAEIWHRARAPGLSKCYLLIHSSYESGGAGGRGLCLAAAQAPLWEAALTRPCRLLSLFDPSHRSSKPAKKEASSCTASPGQERGHQKEQHPHSHSMSEQRNLGLRCRHEGRNTMSFSRYVVERCR